MLESKKALSPPAGGERNYINIRFPKSYLCLRKLSETTALNIKVCVGSTVELKRVM